MEYYSAMKKNKTMPFAATWVKLETLILSNVSQKEKDKYHMISLISEPNIGTNESFHRKETYGLGEQSCGCHGGGGGSVWLTDANYLGWIAVGSCCTAV